MNLESRSSSEEGVDVNSFDVEHLRSYVGKWVKSTLVNGRPYHFKEMLLEEVSEEGVKLNGKFYPLQSEKGLTLGGLCFEDTILYNNPDIQ